MPTLDQQHDIALYVFQAIFLASALSCYGCEVWARSSRVIWHQRASRMKSAWLFRIFRSELEAAGLSASLAETGSGYASAPEDAQTIAGPHNSGPVALADKSFVKATDEAGLNRANIHWAIVWFPAALWYFAKLVALLRQWHGSSGSNFRSLISEGTGWNDNTTTVNADIGGDGVRAGLYIPAGLLVITLTVGFFHNEDSGAKEVGNAQLLSLLYLNFNAAKAAGRSFRDLTFPEVVAACISIDVSAAALHMANSSKEALAARWYIAASSIMQVTGVSLVVAMLARIQRNYQERTCATIIWWGKVSSCSGPSGTTWLYIAVRAVILAHGVWLDCYHSSDLHLLEVDWAELAPGDREADKLETRLSSYQYATLRATSFSKWIEWLPSVVVGICSFETLIRRVTRDDKITDWGQSASLVLAIAGGVHWLYVFSRVGWEAFSKDARSKHKQCVNYPRFSNDWDPQVQGTDEQLLKAAREGEVQDLRRALRHRAHVDAKDKNGEWTALLHAVSRDHRSLVAELLSKKYKADRAVQGTMHATTLAATQGRSKVLRYLLMRYPDDIQVKDPDTGRSLIWLAARYGHKEALEVLLESARGHAEVMKPDKYGRTPIWAAARHGHGGVLTVLLNTTDGPVFAMKPDHTTRTPFFAAAEAGHTAITNMFLDQIKDGLLPSPSPIESMCRTARDLEKCVEVWRGFGVKTSDDSNSLLHQVGRLHALCPHGEQYDAVPDLVGIMERAGLSIDLPNDGGSTALALAVRRGDVDIIDLLHKFGADPFVKDSTGASPFSIATWTEASDWFLNRVFHQLLYKKEYDEVYEDKAWAEILKLNDADVRQLVVRGYLYRDLVVQPSEKPLLLYALQLGWMKCFYRLIQDFMSYHPTEEEAFWPQQITEDFQKSGNFDSMEWDNERITLKLKAFLLKMEEYDREDCVDVLKREVEPAYIVAATVGL